MISKIEYTEAIEVSNILKKSQSISTNKVLKEVLEHVGNENSLALKLKINNKIVGIWCSYEFEDYISLSFFYTDESIRRKPDVIVFFMHCYNKINNIKPILIETKDITGFERYVVAVDGNPDLYVFKGFR